MIYITDGSFEGILTAVFEAYERKEEPEAIYSSDGCQMRLASEARDIMTDASKSDRVYRAIVGKMSQESLEDLYRAFLSEHPDCGTYIYRYIKIGLKVGRRVVSFLQNPDVLRVHDLSCKVLTECHLFLGMLRFRKAKSGIFYAGYEPDNNITMLLTDHFAERLSDQPWIIHDQRRDIFALFNTEEVIFSTGLSPSIIEADDEEEFEALWKRYFKSIAIESRRNLKLQRSFMPRRYWKHLIEKQL
jgi:probable DNA metabolism protein